MIKGREWLRKRFDMEPWPPNARGHRWICVCTHYHTQEHRYTITHTYTRIHTHINTHTHIYAYKNTPHT